MSPHMLALFQGGTGLFFWICWLLLRHCCLIVVVIIIPLGQTLAGFDCCTVAWLLIGQYQGEQWPPLHEPLAATDTVRYVCLPAVDTAGILSVDRYH